MMCFVLVNNSPFSQLFPVYKAVQVHKFVTFEHTPPFKQVAFLHFSFSN